ncbi:unnamed protein product [Ceutorhynchus assimilis]|uniref:CPC1/SPEF2 domain-containing protein n=1 Tax=Ceutorhynchus assimilis TaxID=467358 RepID=A0A9N9QJJ4_9CUCU|nr:unnamed protein product [Ceutorhynchus assimilis]
MSEIISKWILNRINYVADMTPEIFRVKTANGRLLSQLLHSYKIITTEDLNSLKKTDHLSDCKDNFTIINFWLNNLHVNLSEENIYDIVNGIGSASLDLFFRVLLELKDKTKFDVNDRKLIAQLGKIFYANKPSSDKDLEIINKKQTHIKYPSSVITEDDEELRDLDTRTYEELISLQNEARKIPKFVPDPKKVKQIINNLHKKRKMRQENNKLKKKLPKAKSEDDEVMRHQYSKQLIHTKTENEYKPKQQNFIEALESKDYEFDKQKLLYYLERERVQKLHKKIWNQKVKLKQQTINKFCNDALEDIVKISIETSKYKKRYRQEPSDGQMENLKKQFLSGGEIFKISAPKFDDVQEVPEEIITININRRSKIDEEGFENYMNHKGTWEQKKTANAFPVAPSSSFDAYYQLWLELHLSIPM